MPGSSKSSVQNTPRPTNVFYVWYTELCRRLNTSPVPAVKPAKPKSNTVLDFVGDRIKAEEWIPVLSALEKDTSLHVIAIRSRIECQFLFDVDSEEKLRRMKRRYGCLWTSYVSRRLVKSVASVLRHSSVLSSLELDGIPLNEQYLEPILQELKKNNTLRTLSFQHCPIKDSGCEQLCFMLRHIPNIEVINLSGCDLTSAAAKYIANLIKYQQINRYSESWHNSLRYEDPDVGVMRGLKRITLNCNPNIGDKGLSYILDELDDDLWIKALDMQKCGITENIAKRLIDIIVYSRSLQIADFRHNEKLSTATIERILEILSQKQNFGYDSEYRWCLTASTYYPEDNISANGFSTVRKSKSAPFKQVGSSVASEGIRKTKTYASIPRSMKKKTQKDDIKKPSNIDINQARKQIEALNTKLQEEITKRHEMEEVNASLKSKLSNIIVVDIATKQKVETTAKDEKEDKSKVRKGVKKKSIKFSPAKPKKAENIFKNFLYKDGMSDAGSEDEEAYMKNYYEFENVTQNKVVAFLDPTNEETLDDMSASNISLKRFMEELQNDNNNLGLNFNELIRPQSSSSSRTRTFMPKIIKVR